MSRNVDLATRLKVLLCVPAPAKSFYRRFLSFYRLKFKHFRRFLFLIYFTMYLETTSQVERKVVQVSRNRKVLLVSCDYFSVGVSSTLGSPINNSVRDVAGPAEVAAATMCYTHHELRRKTNNVKTVSYLTPNIHFMYTAHCSRAQRR